ncbi:MAG TPA: CoA pyrophosphatase [Ohtaekwangia sp.]|nr:CoA pyrophosphatase [Ohtaekwangia sp.]
MQLDALTDKLSRRLERKLPGISAHDPLRAVPVGTLIPKFEHKLPPRPGGVLILLYEAGGQIRFPLIKRSEYIGAHSGQVSLPGGKSEPGEDVITTALREGEEEIGIDHRKVNVIGKLSDFFVIPSNFMVTPIIATTVQPVFTPDKREVARILSCSLFDLLLEGSIKQKEIIAAGQFRMMAPHFEIDDEIVWGATAMMLNEFRMVLLDL